MYGGRELLVLRKVSHEICATEESPKKAGKKSAPHTANSNWMFGMVAFMSECERLKIALKHIAIRKRGNEKASRLTGS